MLSCLAYAEGMKSHAVISHEEGLRRSVLSTDIQYAKCWYL